ncbi:MAG: STAS domain-containing protein [Bacteroidota bacterium]
MEFSIKQEERYCVFKLHNENLNSLIAPHLKSKLVLLANEGVKNCILDLTGVGFVDSSGLSAILTGHRLFAGEAGNFILTGATQPAVDKLLEISRLKPVLTLIPTVKEAVDYVVLEEIQRSLSAKEESEGATGETPAE